MIILKIEFAATLRALAAVPLEDGPAHLTTTRRPATKTSASQAGIGLSEKVLNGPPVLVLAG
jgi:hypothetical protein